MTAGIARRIILPFYPAYRGTKEGCDHSSDVGIVHSKQGRKGPVSLRKTIVLVKVRKCPDEW